MKRSFTEKWSMGAFILILFTLSSLACVLCNTKQWFGFLSQSRVRTFGLLTFALFSSTSVAGTLTSYRVPHPIAWMHALPTGEMPGWTGSYWLQFEVNHANIWNAPMQTVNVESGRTMDYTADYEQTSTILEVGGAINESLSFALEVPYSHKSGGFLDRMIDQFHIFIGADRFNRPEFEENDSTFDVRHDESSVTGGQPESGLGNVKFKLKWWALKWLGFTPGSCPCGIGLSAHVKQPLAGAESGLSTGSHDVSLLTHLAMPLGEANAIWFTAGATKLGPNPLFSGFPRRDWLQMYELSMDFALSDYWGIMLQARTESPLLNKGGVRIVDTTEGTDTDNLRQRVSSGWNSLVHWRTTESIGLRYRPDLNSQVNLLLIEDWGVGEFDERGDRLYVNNAPDVAFILQYQIGL